MNVNCTTTVPRSNYYSILKKRKCSYKENVTVKLKRHSAAVENDSRLEGYHSVEESVSPKSNHKVCTVCQKQNEYMRNRHYDSLTTLHQQAEQQHHLQLKQQNDIQHRQSCRNEVVKTSSRMPSSANTITTTNSSNSSTNKSGPLQIANQQSQSEWNASGVRSSWSNSSHHCSRSCSMPSCQLQSTSHSSVPYAVSETPSLSPSSPSLSPSSVGALPLSSLSSPSPPQTPVVVPPPQPPTTSATCSLSLLRPSLATETNTNTSKISSSSLSSGSSQPPSSASSSSSSRTNALLSGSTSLGLRGNSWSSNTEYSACSSDSDCAKALRNARVTNVDVLRTFAFVTVMLGKCFAGLFGTRQRIRSEHEIDNQVKTRRQSKKSNTNSFPLPKFPLIFTCLILSLTTLMMPTSVDAEVRLQRKEHVCKSKDIRNSPEEFYQLTNCTVIEGFLLITLIDASSSEYQKHSFPLLTEVTEFVMIYHVNGLRTLSTLFPNLSVIRGKNLFEGYALVLYENRHLEDVGLPSLITIARGAVRIEKNPDMCFVNTIDWAEIAVNMTNDQHFFRENKPKKECPLCPGDREKEGDRNELNVSCPVHQGKRHCWNSRICQKICPAACKNNCNEDLQCCDEACIGGCDKLNKSSCSSCRHLANTTVCMDKCPPNFFSYQDRRCITAETCTNVIGMKLEGTKPEYLVPYNGTCSVHCPPGHNKVGTTCRKCEGKCEKKCEGRVIDSVGVARQLHGCTHIYGSALTISIKQGGRHLMEELEMGLSSIEVIDTYLKVHRTYGLVSLSFFKNLRVIKGQILESDKFVLYVLENQDLESIWGPNQTVKMEEGRVFFHFNPKLCFSVIDSIRPSLKNTTDFDKNEVAQDSNGSKGSCNTTVLNVEVEHISSSSALVVITNPMAFEDDRVFIGYQFFHTVDPYGNVSMFGHKPCDDRWSSEDPSKEEKHYFLDLKPFTQYAFYVKTQTISSERSNGLSKIMRFRTKPDQPKSVQYLVAYSNSSSEIVVNWQRPSVTNGNLTKYIITATLDTKDPEKLATRNYCREPLKEVEPVEAPWTTDEKSNSDCVCEKNVTRKDGPMPLEEEEFLVNAIDFENNIQNFVYVKQTNDQPNDTFLDTRRRRRAIDFGSAILSRVTRSSFQSHLMNPENVSKMDLFGNYYEHIVETINASNFKKEEFVLKKLKHFSSYTIIVKACRAPEEGATSNECSPESRTVVRTQKLSDVDIVRNLHVKLEQSNTTRGNLRVKWEPPERPNSLIVSYTIFYHSVNSPDAVREKRCITEPDYLQNFTSGYLLEGLSTGNYSIQVRANSLAGEGIRSEPFYIYIPPQRVSAQTITLIVVILSILLIIIVCVIYYIRKKFMAPPTDLKIFPTVNPYYISMQYIPDEWEVPREKIIQLGALGQGSFGMVYEGILKNNGEDTPCAIKTVNESATDSERLNFLKEASVMKEFNTHHVVRLLGVCSRGQPAFVIMELMKNGDLKAYLRQHRPNAEPVEPGKPPLRPPTLGRILQIAIEIADGMAYLAAKKFVHRDLAARNCMVAADLTVKIGDFGMTRDIYETDYYRKGTKGLLPVRWMAPESLKDGVFSSASDVFSYGVVLWEMATLASQPYQGFSNEQVLHFVIDGGVMARPDNCPDKLYKLMQRCWEHRPSARPSFMEIIRYLLDSADPKFQEVSFYHSAEAKDILDQMQPEHDLDDVRTPLRVDEFDYQLNIDDNSSVEQHDSPALDEEDEDDDDEIVQRHSPYSLGSANMINNSTPGGHSRNSSNVKINQSNPSLSLPSTSAAAIAASIATSTAENIAYIQPDPLYQHYNDHRQMEQNENCKFLEDDKTNQPPPAKKAIKNKSLSSNTSKYPNSLKRAVASTVQNVSNSLVPLRLSNMNFLHHRLFKNNSNSSSSGGKGDRNNTNINTKSDTTNSNNGNNNSSNSTTANAETGSTGSRSFFSALTPSHTSKNPNYQILHESINIAPDEQHSIEEGQPSMDSPQQTLIISDDRENINKNDGNNAMKQNQQLNRTTEQCNLNRDSTNLAGSNNKFKYTNPSQSNKINQPTNATSTAHELTSSSGVSSPIRIKTNRNTSNTPAVISTSTPLKTKTPYQLKENWLKQLPQMPPPNGFIGREG